jgi:hypothetical protein
VLKHLSLKSWEFRIPRRKKYVLQNLTVQKICKFSQIAGEIYFFEKKMSKTRKIWANKENLSTVHSLCETNWKCNEKTISIHF